MTIERLVSRYIKATERVFTEITISNVVSSIDQEKIKGVIERAKRYLEDAKYYLKKNELETGLASVSYCEGLLDALRLLEMVEFSWPAEK